jgi:hypothetical protein
MVREGVSGPLEGSTLLVALAFADRANKSTGQLRVGLRGLAARTGLHYSTVHAAVGELIGADMLDVLELGVGNRPTHYRLVIVGAIADAPVDNHHPRSSGRSLLETQRAFIAALRAGEPRVNARVSRAEPVPVYEPAELSARVNGLRTALRADPQ